jgi:hypothetical protein
MGWFRYYDETLYEAKLIYVADKTGFDFLFVQGAWSSLLCLANRSPIRGKLLLSKNVPMAISNVSVTLHCTEDVTLLLFNAFKDVDMLTFSEGCWAITNWDKRQFESDKSNERVRKYRQKKQNSNESKPLQKQDCNVTVTPPEAEAEQNSETEIKEEEIVQIPSETTSSSAALSTTARCHNALQALMPGTDKQEDHQLLNEIIGDYNPDFILEILLDMRSRSIKRHGVFPYLRKVAKDDFEAWERSVGDKTAKLSTPAEPIETKCSPEVQLVSRVNELTEQGIPRKDAMKQAQQEVYGGNAD